MRNQRLLYIDSIKGLAILLMVMGHVIATQYPNPYFVLDFDNISHYNIFMLFGDEYYQ